MHDEPEAIEGETVVSQSDATAFVVDDDEAVCRSLQRLLESRGLEVETYRSAQTFLDAYDPTRPGCLVLDLRMPGMGGLELQDKLAAQQIGIPIVIITGHGDVPNAVRALKAGAADFIEKPFKPEDLLERIRQAIASDAEIRRARAERGDILAHIARLTPRERQVMHLLVAGKANKQIGLELGISSKTVEIHRARLMERMEADSVAALVRMALISGAHAPQHDPAPR